MKNRFLRFSAALIMPFLAFIAPANAEPEPYQMIFQPAATPVMERITDLHNMVLYIITAICIFVFALMLYIFLRFNAKANPEPSRTTHHTMLEVIWTVLPVIILIVIAVPSLKLLYYADRTAEPEMTLKITGLQWYWNYTYMDGENEFSFDSRLIRESDKEAIAAREAAGGVYKRLLSADNQLVLPTDTNIQLLITAGPDDVLHAFAVPAFGVKLDAVPGRINETWTRIEKPGTYYGQCSELCGKDHAYMPIEVRAVPKEEFQQWLAQAKEHASYDEFKTQQKVKLAQAEGLE